MGSLQVDLIKVKLNFSSSSVWAPGKPLEGPSEAPEPASGAADLISLSDDESLH